MEKVSPFLTELVARLERYNARIAEIQTQLQSLSAEQNDLMETKTHVEALLAKEKGLEKPLETGVGIAAPMGLPFDGVKTGEALEKFFRDNGNQTARIETITKILLVGGWKTKSTTPEGTVYHALRRESDKYERMGNDGYRLKSVTAATKSDGAETISSGTS